MIDAETRDLSVRLLEACRARKWTLATAESCTGGLVAGALTEIAGSSDVVDRGFVTYSNAAKMAMLGVPEATLNRAALRTVQTPQAFAYPALLDAHRRAAREGREDFPDDAALIEWAGLKVTVFEGEHANMKMTTPEDFARIERDAQAALSDVRTGIGYDIHAFDQGGDHVWLGGIKIPHARKLQGHSDADVALHALTDAILGALADGDIGVHFPPSDEKWRGASSDRFLAFAVERVKQRGGAVSHLDVAIVCEAPKVNPHRDAMRARIAEIAGLSIDRVGVKATTNEKLGAIGNGEGIAAYATATVRLPWSAP